MHLGTKKAVQNGFRLRGGEITRIEAFSDAVFAFAVTLLIVSLEVPKTFHELMITMRGFGAFAICFALLVNLWYQQNTFFRRYGLQDAWTIFLNVVLLFVVLFYIYPLKFLFTLVVNGWMGVPAGTELPNGKFVPAIVGQDALALFIIYGAGFLAVFVVFALLYWHALSKREELELNALEVFDTRVKIYAALFNVVVGTISILIARFGGIAHINMAGYIYPLLIGPGFTIYYSIMGRRRRKLERAIA